jgi:putative nucleotidyltransferase with HDIG domain
LAVESAIDVQEQSKAVADLWLDGAPATESDLRAARNLAARLATFDGLRPFSTVVQSLVAEVSRPDFEINDVRKLIEMDPALASRILRVANSAAYRSLGPCGSITQAVVRIGATNIGGLAMAMSAMAMFHDLGGIGRKIRDHSAGTAVIARELAVSLGRAALSSKVFLAGLLHDFGKLLVIQTGDRTYTELAAREMVPSSVHLKELSLWGFDHAMLGAHVLRSWSIPDPVPQIIACHHQPKTQRETVSRWAQALDLLRVADVVDWLLGQSCPADSPWVARLTASPDGIRAGLCADTLPSLWRDLRIVREDALRVFD